VNIVAVIKHIAIKNSNYDAASDYLTTKHDEFTSKPILDENGHKIPRDEFLIEGINCDPYSFGEECEAVNARFGKNKRKEEIKAHHYILSFDPRDWDENGLTADRAQELGMEFARRNFPGHQTIVCTHPDGHNSAGNIHVHIVINSVRMLDVERQSYMERPGDCLAGHKHHVTKNYLEYLKQATMELCQRESFYQVDLLSPAKVRITDREYWAQRKGQAALDAANAEKVAAGVQPKATKFETEKGFLRKAITSVMTDSTSMEEFQKKLFEQYGIGVHESRGRLSYQLPDRNKPIRAKQLGTDFDKGFIERFLSQNHRQRTAPEKTEATVRPKQKPQKRIRLVVDLKNCLKAQENRFYAQKVKVGNLQQMSKSVAFLEEQGIESMEELASLLESTSTDFEAQRSALQETEARLKTVNILIKNTGQYLANKEVYGQYLQAKNKKKFRAEHEPELLLYEAARKALKEASGGEKIPTMKQLKAEKEQLTAKKNEQYESFSFSRAKHRELQTIDANVRSILGMKDEPPQEKKEQEH
jgi:hypothetical protein